MTPLTPAAERPLKEAGVETDGEEQPEATTANEPPSRSDGSCKKRSGVGRWRRSYVGSRDTSRAAIESGVFEADGSGQHSEQAEDNSSSRNGAVRRRRDPRTTRNTKCKRGPFPMEATPDTAQLSSGTCSNLAPTTGQSTPAMAPLPQQCAVSDEADAPILNGRDELTGSEAESDGGSSTTATTVELRPMFKRTVPAVRGNRGRRSEDECDDDASMTTETVERHSVYKRKAPVLRGNRRRGSEGESDDGASITAGAIEKRSVYKRTAPAVRGNRRRTTDRRETHHGTGKEPSIRSYGSRPDKVPPAGQSPQQRAERWGPSPEKTPSDVACGKPSGRRPNALQGNEASKPRRGPIRDRDGSTTAQAVDRSASSTPNADAKSAPRARNWRGAGPGRRAPATSWRTPEDGSSSQQQTLGEIRSFAPRRRGGFSKADAAAGGDAACTPSYRRRPSTWRAPKAPKDNGPAGERDSMASDGASQSATMRGSFVQASELVTGGGNRPKSSVPRETRGQHVEPPAKHAPTKTNATWCNQASRETRAKKRGAMSLNKNKSAPRTFYNSESTFPNKQPMARVRRSLASTATSVQQLDSGGSESSGGVSSSVRRPIMRRWIAEGATAAEPEAAHTQPPVPGHNPSWTGQRHSGTRRPGFYKRFPRANARRELSVQLGATDAVGEAFSQAVQQRRRNIAVFLAVICLVCVLLLVFFVALNPSGFSCDGYSTVDPKCAMPGMRQIMDTSTEACRVNRESNCGCSHRSPFCCEELYGVAVRH